MEGFALVLPEIYLALTVLGLIVGESANHEERARLVLPTSLLGIGGAAIQSALIYRGDPQQIFSGTLSIDGLSLFFKFLFLTLAAAGVSSACLGGEIPKKSRAEFCAILLTGCLSLMLAAAASNLFLVLVSLQVAGACAYMLSGFGLSSAAARASIKLGFASLASGAFLLLGALSLFLLAGTANLYEIHRLIEPGLVSSSTLLFVFAVLFLGLSLPMMVFPGNFWVPGVIHGSNSPAATFLTLGLRAGAFAAAVRTFVVVFTTPGASPGAWAPLGGWDWTQWLAFSAAMTLIFPALLAVRQTHAKRLLACIATVQGGFLLLGLIILEEIGLAAMLFAVTVDLLAFAGLNAVLSRSVERRGSDEMIYLKGSLRNSPQEAVALVFFLVSWLGVPPFAGSVARFALLGAAVRREWYILAFLGLLAFVLVVVASGRLILSVLSLEESDSMGAEKGSS
ncbi:MAG: hypothetical protein KGQ59_06785, partial [Bdellovibrionales bacterium]|nr:hypothetical protein [Bdellovibrionales bacterium]